MKVSASRAIDMRPLRISVTELADLIDRVRGHFSDQQKVKVSIRFKVGPDAIEINSPIEIFAVPDIPATLTSFTIQWIGDWEGPDEHVRLESRKFLRRMPEAVATGASASWCAGAVDIVRSFFAHRRAPFSWFLRLPMSEIGWLFMFLQMVGLAVALKFDMLLRYLAVSTPVYVAVFLLDYTHTRHCPPAVIVVRPGRSRAVDATLFVAVIGIVIAVLAWWFPRTPL